MAKLYDEMVTLMNKNKAFLEENGNPFAYLRVIKFLNENLEEGEKEEMAKLQK